MALSVTSDKLYLSPLYFKPPGKSSMDDCIAKLIVKSRDSCKNTGLIPSQV